jgi:hypothetical protein
MTNYNSNFNNCQIFQPQIINQNYLTTMAPQQIPLQEKPADAAGPKPSKNMEAEDSAHLASKQKENKK